MKSVCALVVTYNRSKYLQKALEGMINQQKEVSGVLIFNNNSMDNTFFQRGLGKKESPWFEIIKEYMRLSELGDNKSLTQFINDFKEKYINKGLDEEFYQRLIPKMDNLEIIEMLL